MAVITTLLINQKGTTRPKKIFVTTRTTIARTMEVFSVKNGILLTVNPAEHTGLTNVDAGRMTQAQISEMVIARAVMPPEKIKNVVLNLVISSSRSTGLPVRKFTFLKRTPGSMICANKKSNTT